MNFADFQNYRATALRENPGLLDCAETNLYAVLRDLIPPPTPGPDRIIHRCHLAEKWVRHFGFSSEMASRSLISCGVRDSLERLFKYYALQKACLWLPSDNYPVYSDLARESHLNHREFPTLLEPAWPNSPPAQGMEVLITTNPLKPLGRWLADDDVASLTTWLAESPLRRLIIDTVYTFDACFHPTTLELLATGQCILLHSLTKGWLQPRLFGVALIPESDKPSIAPLFRQSSPSQPNLARAWDLFEQHAEMPMAVDLAIAASRERLLSVLPTDFLSPSHTNEQGYFFPVIGHWLDLLKNANILGLPATVFGSQCEDISILSSLSFIENR